MFVIRLSILSNTGAFSKGAGPATSECMPPCLIVCDWGTGDGLRSERPQLLCSDSHEVVGARLVTLVLSQSTFPAAHHILVPVKCVSPLSTAGVQTGNGADKTGSLASVKSESLTVERYNPVDFLCNLFCGSFGFWGSFGEISVIVCWHHHVRSAGLCDCSHWTRTALYDGRGSGRWLP